MSFLWFLKIDKTQFPAFNPRLKETIMNLLIETVYHVRLELELSEEKSSSLLNILL